MTRTQSPRIGILGSSTFAPEGGSKNRAMDSQPSNTVNCHIKRIEEQIVVGYELIAYFKQEADVQRQQINLLMNRLMESVDSVQDDVSPETYKDYKTLKSNIKTQKDENEVLLKILAGIQRDTGAQREKVAIFSERILKMEEAVGMIGHNNAYRDSEDDDLFQESIDKNETIEHTNALVTVDGTAIENQSRPKATAIFNGEINANALTLNPASTSSSIQPLPNR